MSRRWRLRNEGEKVGGKERLHRRKLKSVYVSNNLQDGTNDDAAQTLREKRANVMRKIGTNISNGQIDTNETKITQFKLKFKIKGQDFSTS